MALLRKYSMRMLRVNRDQTVIKDRAETTVYHPPLNVGVCVSISHWLIECILLALTQWLSY